VVAAAAPAVGGQAAMQALFQPKHFAELADFLCHGSTNPFLSTSLASLGFATL
jgi:hypothetical protein